MGSCLSRGAVAENKVLPQFDDEKDFLGHRGYIKSIKSKDGASLYCYFWPADPAVPLKGIIQLAHGSAAYTCFDYLKFKAPGLPNVYDGSWVAAFNRAGFSVCGLDQQGAGRSRGAGRGPAKKFQSYVDDLLQLSDFVTEEGGAAFPRELPYFLVGHCVGGLAATLACVQKPGRFAGLVLLSPLLSPEATSLKPGAKLTPKSDGDSAASSDTATPSVPPWISEAWSADPYVFDASDRPHNLEAVRPAAEKLCEGGGLEQVSLPLLIFHSERDTYAEAEGAKKLHDRSTSSDKALRVLSTQWHVLTKEDGWEELLAETSAWLTTRATKTGGLTQGLDAEVTAAGEGKAAEDAAAPGTCSSEKEEEAEASEQPVLTRTMSMLERMPEHEPLESALPERLQASGGGGGGGTLPVRRYSFDGGQVPRPRGLDGAAPAGSAASLLGPLPPLSQRRGLGTLPPELSAYKLRGRLPPLPPLPPLMDKKPLA